MEKKIILGILGVVVLAILAVAIVPQAIGMFGLEGTKEKYKIGVILPATGYFADYGKAALNGIEMAKQDFSNIELLVEDDAGENQQAATAAKKLSGIENVNALITFRSSISSTVAPIAEESKTPLIYSSTIIDPAKKNEYAFQNYANLREDCKELTKITEKIALIGHNLDSTIACIQGIESNKKQVTYELITK
jgi:ABC-type branched-subunit amino acid transport system substrate-binding protein